LSWLLSREVGGENFAFLSEILLACFGDELARRTQHWPPRRRSHFLRKGVGFSISLIIKSTKLQVLVCSSAWKEGGGGPLYVGSKISVGKLTQILILTMTK